MIQGSNNIPFKAGIGLRAPHVQEVLDQKPDISWFEIHPENLKRGAALKQIEQVRQHYPLSFHGVGLSLGSPELNINHLEFLKNLVERLQPGLVSEHLAWNIHDGIYFNDFLPLPYTEESLAIVVKNIQKTQDFLGRQLLVENPSTYMEFKHSTISEVEFIIALAQQSGCQLLLDINNVFISCTNHEKSAEEYVKKMATSGLVGEIHLAGYRKLYLPHEKSILVDSHDTFIAAEVWNLYEEAIKILGPIPTLIEWDNHIPSLSTLKGECEKAQYLMNTQVKACV